jgi:hypothetical protein
LSHRLVDLQVDRSIALRQAAFGSLVRLGGPEGFDAALRLIADRTAFLPERVTAIAAVSEHWQDPAERARSWQALRDVAATEETALGLSAYLAMSRLAAGGPMPEAIKQELLGRLTQHRERYREWRKVRDERLDESADETRRKERRKALRNVSPPIGLTYELAFALCSADRSLAAEPFLKDDLHEVRSAAATYLVLHADVQTLMKIDRWRFSQSGGPPRAAAYRALDLRLRALEGTGSASDMKGLQEWALGSVDPTMKERIAWTVEAIRGRLARNDQ